VALYEQLLQQHALDIAKKYQDQSRWLRAAQNLRAPYWDWAVNSIPPPEVISLEYLDIVKPEGKKTVPNPLFQYKFDPIHPSFKKYYDDAEDDEKPLPYQDWKNTIRHPNNFGKGAKTDVVNLTAYDFTFPDPSLSHLVFPVS
jgi:tyrosinase